MKLCSKHCKPCCDFCRYVIHAEFDAKDETGEYHHIISAPIGCTFSDDKFYQSTAQDNWYCEEFFCKNAEVWINDTDA